MITQFILAAAFTIGVSFVCSMLEALILSTTVADIEALKKRQSKKGLLLEKHKTELSDTISAILTLNTIANTAGSTLVGALASQIFGETYLGVVAALLTLSILIFSEIIPKNLGVRYKTQIQPWVVSPLRWMRIVLWPATWLTNFSVRFVMSEEQPNEDSASNEEEIILLAEKGAKDGTLTTSESDMVTNALKLDDVIVSSIMTPRVVVTALEKVLTIGDVFREYPNIPFARMPVYDEEIDQIVGIARRRDLLKYVAEDQDRVRLSEIMNEVHFVPETVTVAAALQTILKTHQQLLVVVDEFGSTAGVVTMEDIMEYILGKEIFEKDDVAIDMRELAREEAKGKTPDAATEDAEVAAEEAKNRANS
ncbi:hemolysin family protein [Pelagicoccus mobilis]|uniref:HlyC/CorC family transporter n=1 Tax=Pelagicoccus mobilis TaxID=415221 RepID=A0A934VRW1_9BACT|nr:hemolysin family protein [Pelagicoccus mobilis]MBK1879817.1 HlyC/CorC family transporter [Pelagicoccus mobilis]